MDHRLDYINKFEDGVVELMSEIRKKFIALDDELRKLAEVPCPPIGQRTFGIARTNLETGLMFAIKGICLKFEKKE